MNNYLGEIRLFPYISIPSADGWVACNGQTMPLQQNAALFSLLGIIYGGDGKTNFALPNLNGRAMVGAIAGGAPNGTAYPLGTRVGAETVALTTSNIPAHTHVVSAANSYDTFAPTGVLLGNPNIKTAVGQPKSNSANANFYATSLGSGGTLAPDTITSSGSNAPHENRMPYLPMVYCIATRGLYPSRP